MDCTPSSILEGKDYPMRADLSPSGPNIVQASFSAATSADIVAAVAGKVIRVYGMDLSSAGTVTITVKDGTTALEGARTLAAGTPWTPRHPIPGRPAYQTTAGNAFVGTFGGAVQISGSVWYSVGDA